MNLKELTSVFVFCRVPIRNCGSEALNRAYLLTVPDRSNAVLGEMIADNGAVKDAEKVRETGAPCARPRLFPVPQTAFAFP